MVERLFLAVPWGCLRFVIVVFPDHTHLLFLHEKHKGSWQKIYGTMKMKESILNRDNEGKSYGTMKESNKRPRIRGQEQCKTRIDGND